MPSSRDRIRAPDSSAERSRAVVLGAPDPRSRAAVADAPSPSGFNWGTAGIVFAGLLLVGGAALAAATMSDGTREWRRGVGL